MHLLILVFLTALNAAFVRWNDIRVLNAIAIGFTLGVLFQHALYRLDS